MGAKSKPQETVSLADLGLDAGSAAIPRTQVLALSEPPPRGDTRKIEDDGSAAEQIVAFLRRSGSSDERPGLPRADDGERPEGLAGRPFQGRIAGDRRRRRRDRRLGCGVPRRRGGKHGAATVYVADDAKLGASPQPRVDAIAQLVEQHGLETVLFAQSILAADIASGLAARLEAGLNWQLTDLARPTGPVVASSPRSATRSSSTLATSTPRIGLPRRAPDPGAVCGRAWSLRGRAAGALAGRRDGRAGARRGERPSIEDANVIVAGGRGLGEPEKFALVEEPREGARRRRRRDARRGRRRLVSLRGPGRPDGQVGLADALRRLRHLGGDPAQGRDAEPRRRSSRSTRIPTP